MRKHWLTGTVLGLVVWGALGLGDAHAQVYPVTLNVSGGVATLTTDLASRVTLTLSPADWLPSPTNSVTITVNGAGPGTLMELVCPQDNTFTTSACPARTATDGAYNPISAKQLRTSAYPGVCTNYDGDPTKFFDTDFTLTGAVLNSRDCGGMAVIRVRNTGVVGEPALGFFFIVPKDSDFDGMPDSWEALYCSTGNTCLDPAEDSDSGPGPLAGDGIAAFDEYRGFKVSGQYIRTNPRQKINTTEKQKDLFISLVNPAELGATSLLTTLPTTLPPLASSDPADLFLNVKGLVSNSQVHVLCFTPGSTNTPGATNRTPCDEWVDRFSYLTIIPPPASAPAGTAGIPHFTYKAADGSTTNIAPPDDRQITKNALYRVPAVPNPKGVRISESLDAPAAVTLPLGECATGPATGADECIIYTQRIVNDTNTKIAGGGTNPIVYFSYEGGRWTEKYRGTGAPTDPEKQFLRSRHIEFILGHEAAHAHQLTPFYDLTYGYHNPEDAGDNVDVRIMRVVKGGLNKFYIPRSYNTTNQSCFRLFPLLDLTGTCPNP